MINKTNHIEGLLLHGCIYMVTEFLDTEKSRVVIDHRRLQAFNCCVSYIISKPAINQKKKKQCLILENLFFQHVQETV